MTLFLWLLTSFFCLFMSFVAYVHFVAFYARRDKSRFVVALQPPLKTVAYLNAVAKIVGVTGQFTVSQVLDEAKRRTGLFRLSVQQEKTVMRNLAVRVRHAQHNDFVWTANRGRFAAAVASVECQLRLHDMRMRSALPQPIVGVRRIYITGQKLHLF